MSIVFTFLLAINSLKEETQHRIDVFDWIKDVSYLEEYRDLETNEIKGVNLYGCLYPVYDELTIEDRLRLKGQWLIEHGDDSGRLYIDLSEAWSDYIDVP